MIELPTNQVPTPEEHVKKDKKKSKNPKSEIEVITKHIPATSTRHKNPVLEGPQSAMIAPITGSQLVSNNMFGSGKDLKTADHPKKKRKGLKNKAGILAAKKDTPAELEGLTKARNRQLVPEGEDIDKNVLDSDLLEKKCDLCERPRPIFVVDTDDMIKRLPERFLSPLLKNLKKDFNNKRQYLKFLRINAKYIKACNCEDK